MRRPVLLRHERRFGLVALLVIPGLLGVACTSAPAGTSAPASTTPSGSAPIAPTAAIGALIVGPLTTGLPAFVPADEPNSWLLASADAERTQLRDDAGFAREFGPGWEAIAAAADDATDAAAESMAQQLATDIPTTRRHYLIASLVPPNPPVAAQPASAAAGLALLGAALAASQALGLGGTIEPTVNESTSTTRGDSIAEITVNGMGSATASGSRVTADFQFDLVGRVTSISTSATVTFTGSAVAHIEIDGCPDASGASKGKVSLSSSESAANGVGWTRDVGGDFDVRVDDDANIAGLTVDAHGDESVVPSEESGAEPQPEGHELGIRTHAEFGAGPGFSNFSFDERSLGLEITHEDNADHVDLGPLFTSALTAVVASAHVLGEAAERFWRDGKCLELIVAPAGGDVDANSTTEVTVKVKHKFEGNELDKPVKATLSGSKSIDPSGQKIPAPATFRFTAGPKQGDKGSIDFESVSNRGIAKKSVEFTVQALGWKHTGSTPLGDFEGVKCDGIGGAWTIKGTQILGLLTITTTDVITINAVTLAGSYTHHKLQVGGGTTTTADASGPARIVLKEDGSVLMTLDAAPITLETTNQFGGHGIVTIPGQELVYPWMPATTEDC